MNEVVKGKFLGQIPETIQDEWVALPKRKKINFTGWGVVATDNPWTGATDVTITGFWVWDVTTDVTLTADKIVVWDWTSKVKVSTYTVDELDWNAFFYALAFW